MSTDGDHEFNSEQQIYRVVAAVPAGKVASYGQIAELADIPHGARIVGRTLANLPHKSLLPWHRVVNTQGKISLRGKAALFQKELLKKEGILFVEGRIDLTRFRWCP